MLRRLHMPVTEHPRFGALAFVQSSMTVTSRLHMAHAYAQTLHIRTIHMCARYTSSGSCVFCKRYQHHYRNAETIAKPLQHNNTETAAIPKPIQPYMRRVRICIGSDLLTGTGTAHAEDEHFVNRNPEHFGLARRERQRLHFRED